ncbi:hypothetical protein BGZ95_010101 [Linnemannia exigua]|uniref:SGNH hydrolase-type esterase domain-containing protein n=1 Tax=Linnemannia exigua TaxID=604196 RepID=A0AAD4DC58_9FUNG|nr:hypothetical protein BGZ95_010101 [Linnemannia exigua]
MTPEVFHQLITEAKKFKDRSHSTLHDVHLPELTSLTTNTAHDPAAVSDVKATLPLSTVLIGDSMLERLKTTGTSTKLAQIPGSFNAGCGGDKIENVLYRLDLMCPLLQDCNIKLWVVMVGTNNLRKKGFRPADVALYRLLLQALLRVAPGSKVLACEMFRRKDVEDRYVDEANNMVKVMVDEMNVNLGGGGVGEARIVWSEAPTEVTKELLEDHVHLNQEGYSKWDRHLFPRVLEQLEKK